MDNLPKTMQPIWLNLGHILAYCDCQSGLVGFYIRAASNCYYKHQIYKKKLKAAKNHIQYVYFVNLHKTLHPMVMKHGQMLSECD